MLCLAKINRITNYINLKYRIYERYCGITICHAVSMIVKKREITNLIKINRINSIYYFVISNRPIISMGLPTKAIKNLFVLCLFSSIVPFRATKPSLLSACLPNKSIIYRELWNSLINPYRRGPLKSREKVSIDEARKGNESCKLYSSIYDYRWIFKFWSIRSMWIWLDRAFVFY